MIREAAPRRRLAALFGASLLVTLGAARSARADEPEDWTRPHRPDLVFVADPKMGMETGVRSAESLGRVLVRYEETLPRGVFADEHTAPRKLAGVAARTLKLVFLDVPIADLEGTAIHEVFGHGSRARDFGQSASYKLSIPEPYCDLLSPRSDCRSYTEDVTTASGQRDRDLAVTQGGIEANALTTWWIDEHVMEERGWVHHGDLLLYYGSKLAYSGSFLSSSLARPGGTGLTGDDVDRYVGLLQDRFNHVSPGDRASIARRLRVAYLWNFADPMLYFAMYGTLRALYTGERFLRVPLPEAGGVRFLPSPRFGLSPFGAEHYIDLFLGRGDVVADLYGRVGSSGLASYSGGGVRVLGLSPHPRLSLGGDLDVWSQPATLLDSHNDYARPNQLGGNVGVYATVRLLGSVGLTGKLAYKSAGFLTGQPLGDGPYGYLGVTLAAPRGSDDARP